MSFLSGISEAEIHFMEVMNDEFDMDLKHRAPYWVSQMRPNAQCPSCHTPMMIAGWIYREDTERAEGVQKISRFQCNSCNMIVTPVPIMKI